MPRHQFGYAGIELRSRREVGGLRQEYRLPVNAEGTFGRAAVAAGRGAGTGRFVDANPPGAYRIEGNPQRYCGNGVGRFRFLGRSD